MTDPEIDSGRLMLLANPYSSYPDRVEHFTQLLQGADLDRELVVVNTQPPADTDNVQMLAEKLEEGDILAVLGGDGTGNIAVNGVILSQKQGVKLAQFPCGNADDVSISLYGKHCFDDPNDVLNLIRYGRPQSIPVIRTDLDGNVRYSQGYVGGGLSGQSAVEMNRPGYRETKEGRHTLANRLADAGKVLPYLLPRERNVFGYNDEEGNVVLFREFLISNMNLFAREFKRGVDSWGDEVAMLELPPEGFMRNLAGLLLREQVRPELTDIVFQAEHTPDFVKTALAGRPKVSGIKGEPFESKSMELRQDTPLQQDGEPLVAPKGTVLDISVARGLISALRPSHLQPV